MGSSSSRVESDRSSKPSRMNRTKKRLSSLLLCGLTSNSTSRSSVLELESPISSIENIPPASVESVSSAGVSSSLFGSGPVCTSSKTSEAETGESESCNNSAKNAVVKHDSVNGSEDKASTSYEGQPIHESVSRNDGLDSASAIDTYSARNEGMPMTSSDNISLSTVGETEENLDPDESYGLNRNDIPMSGDSDGSVSPDVFPSGISEFNSLEARRNSGRLFGETSSRRSSRRNSDFPAVIFTAGLVDDLGSHDRWLLDISGDLRHDGRGHGYSRSHGRNEERRHFRSQMSERGLAGLDEREHRTRFCASGLHRNGTCSCGSSFLGEEVGSLGSISRVVLLAQALSEVLDEIHRQPLSLSMPMLSLPAPESVVDSFLLKSHKKMDASESGPNYVQQCYICLIDYEEGDKIRVLPCQHEYHAPCVDKWLKEVNGVCPVCRCNVCDTPAATQASVSSSELPA
ncbi:uncharacterized protein LOC112504759 isoform X2 [Cynara cardunculus var. scolymus]|uniref:uncharacterized protein LOC112504759 isoform X2 n=1 Tax=Cynara cardunculus var. scolymus TaxID=59895 RepID=UPI000D62E878|nr:uncharacterized protein LOC112504759 isoform X2 [Cynara cardunculus var. scolymus]